MQTEETTRLEISSASDVDELVQRLADLEHEQIVVAVLDESDALLTAAEFSRVLAAARAVHVSLILESGDGLRRELARMLGWAVVSPPPVNLAHSAEAPRVTGDDVTQEVSPERQRGDTTADLASYVPMKSRNGQAGSATPVRSQSTDTVVIPVEDLPNREGAVNPNMPGAPRRDAPRQSTRPDADATETGRPGPPQPRRHRRAILVGAITAPLVVLLVVAGLLVYVLPTASVTLVPTQRPITASLTYGLASPGTTFDIVGEPTAISHESRFELTIPSTGERFEPDGTAGGTVLFTNPLTKVVSIPAGTKLTGANGVVYVTASDLQVPAADPFGSLSFGSGSVRVSAAIAGPDGNGDSGIVTGQLDSGVFFNNREAITGGTLKRIAVVSEADIAHLKQQAEQDLAARTEAEFLATVPSTLQLVPDSTKLGDIKIAFSQAAGTDGTEVAVTASQEASGQVFDPAKLHERAREEAGRRLAMQAGPDVILLGDTVVVGEPIVLEGGTSFEIQAEAVVRSVITEEERNNVAAQLVGKSRSDGEQLLEGLSDVAEYQVELEPSWLPDRLPELASRIQVEVAGELPTKNETETSRP